MHLRSFNGISAWHMTGAAEGEGWRRPCDWSGMTHKLTCFRDERIQALGVPECLAPTCSALLQPILLGWAGWATRGSPTALNCLLLPLSLETHSSVSIGQMEMVWIWTYDPFWDRLKVCVGIWNGAWNRSTLQSDDTKKKKGAVQPSIVRINNINKNIQYLKQNIYKAKVTFFDRLQALKMCTMNKSYTASQIEHAHAIPTNSMKSSELICTFVWNSINHYKLSVVL